MHEMQILGENSVCNGGVQLTKSGSLKSVYKTTCCEDGESNKRMELADMSDTMEVQDFTSLVAILMQI